MSKVRGVFPLFLATTLGVVNGESSNNLTILGQIDGLTKTLPIGIWVFQPLLAAPQEEKEEQTKS
jgi:hypothetical protein